MSGLARHLERRIRGEGPLTVADWMKEALANPQHGYYRTRDPLGLAGDFVTAPEISQMFGELIGLWCVAVWRSMGAPARFVLAEFGPGRGTLIADALRAARVEPDFLAAADLHLVEISPVLRARQAEALSRLSPAASARWHDSVADLPAGPLLAIANEFFDALPIHQFVRTVEGWRERRVTLGANDAGFAFALAPPGPALALLDAEVAGAPPGAVAEVCPAALAIAAMIGRRFVEDGGAALIFDYGTGRSAPGDSLQAVRRHGRHDPLAEPGEADLTAHVDFAALARAALSTGAAAHGPLPQGELLGRLGLRLRADRLLERATATQSADIRAAAQRLLDTAEMGTLFKALALTAPDLATPPGFAGAGASPRP